LPHPGDASSAHSAGPLVTWSGPGDSQAAFDGNELLKQITKTFLLQ
jgi:hypothetical protein